MRTNGGREREKKKFLIKVTSCHALWGWQGRVAAELPSSSHRRWAPWKRIKVSEKASEVEVLTDPRPRWSQNISADKRDMKVGNQGHGRQKDSQRCCSGFGISLHFYCVHHMWERWGKSTFITALLHMRVAFLLKSCSDIWTQTETLPWYSFYYWNRNRWLFNLDLLLLKR